MIVHILRHAYPLCLFTLKAPVDWPEDHQWVDDSKATEATCDKCIECSACSVDDDNQAIISSETIDDFQAIMSEHASLDAIRLREKQIGKPILVVGKDKAEKADFVVCTSGQHFYFVDNIFTVCADCGGCIQHRPHAPKTPPKVCYSCAEKRMNALGLKIFPRE